MPSLRTNGLKLQGSAGKANPCPDVHTGEHNTLSRLLSGSEGIVVCNVLD